MAQGDTVKVAKTGKVGTVASGLVLAANGVTTVLVDWGDGTSWYVATYKLEPVA